MTRLLWFVLGGVAGVIGIGVAARLTDDDVKEIACKQPAMEVSGEEATKTLEEQ